MLFFFLVLINFSHYYCFNIEIVQEPYSIMQKGDLYLLQ
jgi:hypothetical protein